MFEQHFLSSQTAPLYRDTILQTITSLLAAWPSRPYSGQPAEELRSLLTDETLPAKGLPLGELLGQLRPIVENSIALSHPHTVAHLHSPPLLASLAAEVVVSALNQSMDSFDQSPAATVLELQLGEWLCRETGYPQEAGAIFTAGATQSNFMGLLLARDHALQSRFGWDVRQRGLPPEARRLRFLCSEVAHFTVEKSAYQLGLGSDAVRKVAVDKRFRMVPSALRQELAEMKKKELLPAAIVVTAGTTDFGSIDPMPEISALAREAGVWVHVDAAYGSALLLSTKHRSLLQGLDQADSISIDFHKCFWQAISCGAFLLRNAARFRYLEVHADYLNPASDAASGIPNLVDRSLATTRRFDALKLWFSFQLLGRDTMGAMVDRTLELARYAAAWIGQNPALELFHEPETGCVVFRYLPRAADVNSDQCNAQLRQHLFDRGMAVLGHTQVRGHQCLKFTLMNPTVTEEEISSLLETIVTEGHAIEAKEAEHQH
jgi:L-2,4-diaminobutyrate decarboxylase